MQAVERQPVTIVLLGAPGSGKGTQAAILSAALGIPAVSTGEMLRAECASGSALGRSVDAVMKSGRLVDDKLMKKVVAARLSRADCRKGFILDGFPRTVQQANFLNEFVQSHDLPRPIALHLDVDHAEVRVRLARRLYCPACGEIGCADTRSPVCPKDGTLMVRRADDSESSAISERVRSYENLIASLVGLYQGQQYYRIRGARPVHEVSRDILDVISEAATPSRGRWFRKGLSLAAAARS